MTLEKFQQALDWARGEMDFPGASAAYILADGSSGVAASGYADQEAAEKMTPAHRLLGASIGKTFVSAWALALAGQGVLGIDDKIEKWLGSEDWFPRLPNGPDITLRHLLDHRSGLSDHVYIMAEDPESLLQYDKQTDPNLIVPPRELVKLILDLEPLFPVGTQYAYSDTGYILAALVMEKASGLQLYNEVEKHFLAPLKLTATAPSNTRIIPGLCPGYIEKTTSFGLPPKNMVDGVLVYNPGTEWAGGGFATTPSDLVHWGKSLYEGKALPTDYLDTLLNSSKETPDETVRYGLGARHRKTPYGNKIGHAGWTPGYLCSLGYFIEEKVAVSWMMNADYTHLQNSEHLIKLDNILAHAAMS